MVMPGGRGSSAGWPSSLAALGREGRSGKSLPEVVEGIPAVGSELGGAAGSKAGSGVAEASAAPICVSCGGLREGARLPGPRNLHGLSSELLEATRKSSRPRTPSSSSPSSYATLHLLSEFCSKETMVPLNQPSCHSTCNLAKGSSTTSRAQRHQNKRSTRNGSL